MNQPRFENRSRREYPHAEWHQQQPLKPQRRTITVSTRFMWSIAGLMWLGGFLIGWGLGGLL